MQRDKAHVDINKINVDFTQHFRATSHSPHIAACDLHSEHIFIFMPSQEGPLRFLALEHEIIDVRARGRAASV